MKLLKRSHIIPDFMYYGLFNEKHFIAPLDIKNISKRKLIPNGFYDSNLLCEKCDNEIIGRLENYGRQILFGGVNKNELKPKAINCINQFENKYIHLENIDYTKFKLFMLSILWKASISKHIFFKSVSLNEHEENIRKMIFETNPKKQTDYPSGFYIILDTEDQTAKMIANPCSLSLNANNCSYSFLINGFVFNYKVSGSDDIDLYNEITIKEDNTMNIFIFDKEYTSLYLDSLLKVKLRRNK